MSLLNALRRSAKRSLPLIGPDATTRCRAFVLARQTDRGGFRGRGETADLYYTCFALLCLDALGTPPAAGRVRPYLEGEADGPTLDLVHTASLVRCCALLDLNLLPPEAWQRRLEAYRTPDGGFAERDGARAGSAYGAFLAVSALDDLGLFDPHDSGVVFSLQTLRRVDGGFSGDPELTLTATNATAAAIAVLTRMGVRHDAVAGAAAPLLKAHHDLGGFRANLRAPVPDLLSTATALHALAALGVRGGFDGEKTLQFIEGLFQDDGGFAAHWEDSATDVEYTFYGLLALGELVGMAPP